MPPRIAVIGLGCAGIAVCAELAQRGAEVIGLEQFEIGHTRGGSAHQSRGFRLAYYEHPNYVPMLFAARHHWMKLNEHATAPVFYDSGGLYLSAPDGALVPGSIEAAVRHDVAYEPMDARAVQRRWPVFDLPADVIGLFEPLAGIIIPERAIAAYASMARSAGADLRCGVQVHHWSTDAQGVRVDTNHGPVHADALVICAGAWTTPLARTPHLYVRPSRQVLAWFKPASPALVTAPTLPLWAIELHDQSLLYGFPQMQGLPGPEGFKAARHWPGPTIDPDDECAKQARPGDADDVAPHLARWLPSAAGPVTAVETCVYANSTDGHFRIGRHPDAEHVVVITGLSGHGFKFQPVLGEIAADLLLDGSCRYDIDFLSLTSNES